jgi:hypothetical protein
MSFVFVDFLDQRTFPLNTDSQVNKPLYLVQIKSSKSNVLI